MSLIEFLKYLSGSGPMYKKQDCVPLAHADIDLYPGMMDYDGPDLPERYKDMALWSFNEQSLPDFFDISRDFLKEILAPYHIMTCVTSYNGAKAPRWGKAPESFVEKYHKVAGDAGNAVDNGDDALIVFSQGLDDALMQWLVGVRGFGFFYDVFAYETPPDVKTFEAAQELKASFEDVMRFEYGTCPDCLNIAIGTQKVSIDHVFETIQRVCKAHGRTLEKRI